MRYGIVAAAIAVAGLMSGCGSVLCVDSGCSLCQGKGRYTCETCTGSGSVTCPACSGKKRVVCSACKGTKERTCDNCAGTGMVKVNKQCAKCVGTGQIKGLLGTSPCSACQGTGVAGEELQVCPRCNNTRKVLCGCQGGMMACETCGSTGSIRCRKCGGRGDIAHKLPKQ